MKERSKSKREVLLSDIREIVESSLVKECLTSDTFKTTVMFPSAFVEVFMKDDGKVEVQIVHKGNDHWSSLLEEAITENLPTWEEVCCKADSRAREEEDFRDYLTHNCIVW